MARRRLGTSTLAILRALAQDHNYGFDVMDATGLPGGTVYPALAKLESDGLVSSRWEDAALAQAEKRPPRRYYALTDPGTARLERELGWLTASLDTAVRTR